MGIQTFDLKGSCTYRLPEIQGLIAYWMEGITPMRVWK